MSTQQDRSIRPAPRTTGRAGHRNEALRATWFEAAHEVLATQGYGGLKLAPLCRKLGVTTGSFYHSFPNWPTFTADLLQSWHDERTAQTIAIARERADAVSRLELLLEASSALQHRAEAAIRVWAGTDERVAQVQRAVDEQRYQVVHEAMVALVGEERAEDYAVWAMSTLIGYEMLAADHDRRHLEWSLQQIIRVATRG